MRWLRRLYIAACVLISILLLIAFVARDDSRIGWSPKVRSIRTLTRAAKIEVFRTDGENFNLTSQPGEQRIGGFLVTQRGKDQGAEFAARLAEILADPRTSRGPSPKCYWPGANFRAWDASDAIDVLICFKCQNLYVGPPSQYAHENMAFGGSPNAEKLLNLAKEAFPDDPEIQGIALK